MEYAGFWRRFGAMWIDFLVYMPLIIFVFYFSEKSRFFYLYWFVPSILIGLWFSVYLVVRYGGTPGKLLLKTRIAMVDGSNVTLKGAFLRYMILLVFSVFSSIGLILATLKIPDAQYYSLGFLKRTEVIVSVAPSWYKYVEIASNIWIYSEFVTILFNKRRRAIHDFIAGTVVIKKS